MPEMTRKDRLLAMLAETPNDPDLRYFLAMEHVSGGDDPTALACFTELRETSPDYVPGYLQAGQLLARLGRLTEAKETFRHGIEAARRVGDAHAAAEMTGMLDTLE